MTLWNMITHFLEIKQLRDLRIYTWGMQPQSLNPDSPLGLQTYPGNSNSYSNMSVVPPNIFPDPRKGPNSTFS